MFLEFLRALAGVVCAAMLQPSWVSAAEQQTKHMALQSHFTRGLAVKITTIKGRVCASKESHSSFRHHLLACGDCGVTFGPQNRCGSKKIDFNVCLKTETE